MRTPRMRNAAAEGFAYLEFGTCVLAFLPIMKLSSLRHRGDPTQRHPGRWMRRLGWLTSRLNPLWQMGVAGEAPSDIRERPYVVVANHESLADPFLLTYLPWDMRWIAKNELFKIPVVGKAFKWSGDIPIRRGDGDSVRTMMTACKKALDAGISVMIFPEGTRSRDGELLPFRDGAFSLAIEAGVPVLPLAVAGTKECLAKGSSRLGRARAKVRVLAPISTEGLDSRDVAALRERVRDAIAEALPGLRDEVGVVRRAPKTDTPATAEATPMNETAALL